MLIPEFKGFVFFIYFRKYIRAFKNFQKALKNFLDYVDFFFCFLNNLFGLFLDVCLAVIRRLDFKLYSYGWSSPFPFFITVKLWLTLFEDFGWRFWWIWCKTIFSILNLVLQLFLLFHLGWIFELFFQYYCNLKHKFFFLLFYSRSLDWDKIFLVIFIKIFSLLKIYMYINLFFLRYFLVNTLNIYRRLKAMQKKRKKHIIKRKLKARKLRLLRLKRIFSPLKFYWSLINWEYEPAKFLWEFYSASYTKFIEDRRRIRYYYGGLYQGLRDRIRGVIYETGKDYGFIYFFVWLTYYLTIIANGIYIKYLVVKFIFFFCKYLWNWIFFLIDFPLKYAFKNTIIYWLHVATLKRIYRFVNFFVFIGIPNILSYHFWIDCLIFMDLWFNSMPSKIEAFYLYIANLKNKVIRFFFSIHLKITLRFFSFMEILKAFQIKILKVKIFFLNYYLKILFRYSIIDCSYSKKGGLFWHKIIQPRLSFLFKNVKVKSFKFFKGFLSNQTIYSITKIKLYFNKVWGSNVALWKYRIAIFLDLKIYRHKGLIIYSKLIKFLSFFCLNFIKLLIKMQCLYFVMDIKFNEFYIDNSFFYGYYNFGFILEQLEDKIAQNCENKSFTLSKKSRVC